jgi:nucleotide-binding universal stress UspA family protein
MKTILVPVDFSINSVAAVRYAHRLSRRFNAQLVLFHVASIPTPHPELPIDVYLEQKSEILDEKQLKLQTLKSAIYQKGSNIDYLLSTGNAVDEIIRVAGKINADLIVMGTKGANGLREIFIGSNTAKVMEESEVPVLAIPENFHSGNIDKIVLAVDYRDSDIDAIKKTVELAKLFAAEITVVHVDSVFNEPDLFEWFTDQVLEQISYKNINFKLLKGEDFQEVIQKFLEREKADLLVMNTRRRTFTEKIFNRSKTKRLAYKIKIPLYAFKNVKVEHPIEVA